MNPYIQYIFLCNLCINGLYVTAGFYPKFLMDLLSTSQVISYAGCLLQGFVLHSSACADFSILVIMAYDRYGAVVLCWPLVYHSDDYTKSLCVCVYWLACTFLFGVHRLSNNIKINVMRLTHTKNYCIHFLIGKLVCSASIANVIVPAFNDTHIYLINLIIILILAILFLLFGPMYIWSEHAKHPKKTGVHLCKHVCHIYSVKSFLLCLYFLICCICDLAKKKATTKCQILWW